MSLLLRRWVDKVAIVTGASAGIGEAIAIKLIEHGVKVVGLARRGGRLESLAEKVHGKKGKFFPFPTDVSREADIIKAFAWTSENVGPCHILVNNAGIFRPVILSDFKTEDAKAILDVNILGLTIAAREALKIFTEKNINGHIININSVFGHSVIDFEGASMYNASKYAVTVLSKWLYLEMKRNNLGTKVTSISPALVATEIIDNKLMENAKSHPEFGAILKAEDVADAVVYVLSTPPHCQIDELTIRPIDVKTLDE